MICKKCGAENDDNAKYCMQCANQLKEECPNCHELIELDAETCPKCGQQLKEEKISDAKPVDKRKKVFTIISTTLLFVAFGFILLGIIRPIYSSISHDLTTTTAESVSITEAIKRLRETLDSLQGSLKNESYYSFIYFEYLMMLLLFVSTALTTLVFTPFIIINGIKVLKNNDNKINYKMPAILSAIVSFYILFLGACGLMYIKSGDAYARTLLGGGPVLMVFGIAFIAISYVLFSLREKTPIIRLISNILLSTSIALGAFLLLCMMTPMFRFRYTNEYFEQPPLSAGLETMLYQYSSSGQLNIATNTLAAGYVIGMIAAIIFSLSLLFGLSKNKILYFAFSVGSAFIFIVAIGVLHGGYMIANDYSTNGITYTAGYFLMLLLFSTVVELAIASFITDLVAKKKQNKHKLMNKNTSQL